MKKAYFQYYETFENILEKIKDIEEREHFRKIIIKYGLYGEEPTGIYSEAMEIAWAICKDLIDQQRHRREVNAENARNRKLAQDQAEAKQEKPAEPAAPEVKEKPESKKFIKPTVEEIADFCKEKKLNVNALQFFNYYEANGWKVGRNSMKSWQAAVQNWANRERTPAEAGTMWAINSSDAKTAEYEDLF